VGACAMAAVRSLMQTSLPRWSWVTDEGAVARLGSVHFVVMHDRSIDVILNNQRGEGFVKQVFRLVLMGCSSAHTVVDVGANTGYYSMASAAFGCRVLAFDAQPGCRQWWEAARLANDANVTRANGVGGPFSYFDTSRVKLVTRPVSAHPATVEIDQWACWSVSVEPGAAATHSHRPHSPTARLRCRAG
jgi:hypothetical protein